MTYKNILTLFLLICSSSLFSQGLVESPLTINQALADKWNELNATKAVRAPSVTDTLNIGINGILDDFSADFPYPDTAIWLDNFAFINRTMGKAPITLGVATLDGLNERGYPYDFSMPVTSSGQADYFTSKPINLNFTVSDSIYFSFYFQAQGNGNPPQSIDSLVLEFKGTGAWKHIWAKKGSSLAGTDSSWTLVMIPIKDTSFLKKGFQFRFRNYATLCGNFDNWNIDYVYLKKNRHYNEKQFNDIAYVYNGVPLLKNYTVMPWKQFQRSDLRDSVPNWIRNNYTGADKNISYGYKITDDLTSSVLFTYPSGASFDIRPFDSTHIYTDCKLFQGCLKSDTINEWVFPQTLSAPAKYSLTHYIGTDDSVKVNDTLKVHQNFSNYYAYDDGTAEYAIGLSVFNSKLAEKFNLNVPDTLRYVDIYFNPQEINAKLYTFLLNVWNDNNGSPGAPLYTSDTTLKPMYDTSKVGPNHFIRYRLEPPLSLNASAFYIGFTQKTNQILNVGLDKNNNTQSKIFYNLGNSWSISPFSGSLMMHPVFGAASDFVGIENQTSKNHASIIIYPNPANDRLFLKSDALNPSAKILYTVLDLLGRTVIENKSVISEPIDISTLSDGVYFVRLVSETGISTNKFIKVK